MLNNVPNNQYSQPISPQALHGSHPWQSLNRVSTMQQLCFPMQREPIANWSWQKAVGFCTHYLFVNSKQSWHTTREGPLQNTVSWHRLLCSAQSHLLCAFLFNVSDLFACKCGRMCKAARYVGFRAMDSPVFLLAEWSRSPLSFHRNMTATAGFAENKGWFPPHFMADVNAVEHLCRISEVEPYISQQGRSAQSSG